MLVIVRNDVKTKNGTYKRTWRSSTCRNAKQGGGQIGRQTQKSENNVASMLASISQKPGSLLPLKEKMNRIEKAVEFLSAKYDGVLVRISQDEKETKLLKKHLEKIEHCEAEVEISKLKQEVNVLEWRSR